MPGLGEVAPDFALYDADKNVRTLAEFLIPHRKIVLAFFPGAFTGVCTQEMCKFRDMMGEIQQLKAGVVGISVDAPFAQKAFAEQNGLNFPLLCDFKREIIRLYGLVWNNLGGVNGYDTANRAIFVLDDRRVIRFKWVAPNPGTLPDFEQVKAALQ